MSEEKQELETGSEGLEQEETQEEEPQESTGSSEAPEDNKIKELEGTKEYYKKQYKKLKEQMQQGKESEGEQKDYLTRDEAMLIAQGYDENDLEQLNAIAAGKGISLKDAKEDPLYAAYKNQKSQQETQEKAQLGASNGAPTSGGGGNTQEDIKKRHEELLRQYGEK